MATPELILYQYPSCPFCRRVLNAVDDLKVDVEMRNTMTNPKNRSDLVSLMGSSQVPTLLIDGSPMRESADIINWLYKEYGKGKEPPRSSWW